MAFAFPVGPCARAASPKTPESSSTAASSIRYATRVGAPSWRPRAGRCRRSATRGSFVTRDASSLFSEPYAWFEFLPNGVATADTRLRRFHFLDRTLAAPTTPTPAKVERVIGSRRVASDLYGGAMVVSRIDIDLRHFLERPLSSFTRVLDWAAVRDAYCGIFASLMESR